MKMPCHKDTGKNKEAGYCEIMARRPFLSMQQAIVILEKRTVCMTDDHAQRKHDSKKVKG